MFSQRERTISTQLADKSSNETISKIIDDIDKLKEILLKQEREEAIYAKTAEKEPQLEETKSTNHYSNKTRGQFITLLTTARSNMELTNLRIAAETLSGIISKHLKNLPKKKQKSVKNEESKPLIEQDDTLDSELSNLVEALNKWSDEAQWIKVIRIAENDMLNGFNNIMTQLSDFPSKEEAMIKLEIESFLKIYEKKLNEAKKLLNPFSSLESENLQLSFLSRQIYDAGKNLLSRIITLSNRIKRIINVAKDLDETSSFGTYVRKQI